MDRKSKKREYERAKEPKTPSEWHAYRQEKKMRRREWKTQSILKQQEKEEAKVKAKEEKLKREQQLKEKLLEVRTFSIAVPGSVLNNAQTPQLRSLLGAQIARAAAIYCISEIVVFDETNTMIRKADGSNIHTPDSRCCETLCTLLQYLETPQYMRTSLFPMMPDLAFVGLLPPMNCPHHLSATDESEYREGFVLDTPAKEGCSLVDVGLEKKCVHIDKALPKKTRCTVKLLPAETDKMKKIKGEVVCSQHPTAEHGTYWGYTVRLALGLSEALTCGPYPGGYDLLIGTSDKGENLDDITEHLQSDFRHALIVFGGVKGLEYSLDNDPDLSAGDVADLFDVYVNTCPGQGSRTIRSEEAILLSLSSLRPHLQLNKLRKCDL